MNIAQTLASPIASASLTVPLSVTQRTTVSQAKAVSQGISSSSSNVVLAVNSSSYSNSSYSTELTALPSVTRAPSTASANDPERSAGAVPTTSSEPGSDVDANKSESKPVGEVTATGDDQKSAEENPEAASRASVHAEQGGADSASGLTEEEFRQITELAARDLDVRAHEQAHKSVGGQYTGAVSYSYQTGPNGKRYAIGGEVPIDASPISGDPSATIAKMRTVISAARAPADPSPQDIKVASMAAQHLTRAQVELSTQKREQLGASNEPSESLSERANAANAYQQITGLIETEDNLVDEFA